MTTETAVYVLHERQDENVTESALNEARDWTGEWWLPDDPETKVPGVLSFSPDEGLRLRLIGGWDHIVTHPGQNGSTIVTDELKRWPMVLGTADGRAITLSASASSVQSRTASADYSALPISLN